MLQKRLVVSCWLFHVARFCLIIVRPPRGFGGDERGQESPFIKVHDWQEDVIQRRKTIGPIEQTRAVCCVCCFYRMTLGCSVLAKRSERLGATQKGFQKVISACKPFAFVFGIFFILVTLLIFVSVLLTDIDKIQNSCGAPCGFIAKYVAHLRCVLSN